MTVPSTKVTILKNGIGVTQPTATAMLVLGPADSETSSGVINQISTTQSAINLYGYTPVAEVSSYIAKYAGQCYALDLPATRTKVTSATMVKTGTSASNITIDGYATNDYEILITIGDGYTYTFSLDGGLTTSKVRRITTGGTFVLPGSGLTITFGTSTGYVSGDTFTYAGVGPKLSTSDLAAAFTTIKNYATKFFAIVVYDGFKTSAQSEILAGILGGELTSLQAIDYFTSAIIGYGELSTVSDTQASLDNWTNNRVQPAPAKCLPYSALPREGYTGLDCSLAIPYASRLARCLLSEDPCQTDRGTIDGVYVIYNDEKTNAQFDEYRAITAMKYPNADGWYFTNSWMHGDIGEDVQYIQHRRVMDAACAVVQNTSMKFIKRPTRTNADGTIYEADATKYESIIEAAIDNNLVNVPNSAGTTGHISGYKYTIDRTTNLIQTQKIVATLSIQPLGYPGTIETTISFVATLA